MARLATAMAATARVREATRQGQGRQRQGRQRQERQRQGRQGRQRQGRQRQGRLGNGQGHLKLPHGQRGTAAIRRPKRLAFSFARALFLHAPRCLPASPRYEGGRGVGGGDPSMRVYSPILSAGHRRHFAQATCPSPVYRHGYEGNKP